jgi:hypothetical protein
VDKAEQARAFENLSKRKTGYNNFCSEQLKLMLGMKTSVKDSLKQIALKWKNMSLTERTKYDNILPKVA